MRKNFLVRQYSSEPAPGTLSMTELRNFGASKILEIPNQLNVNELDISWAESLDNTQGINIDDQTKNLNVTELKSQNHEIRILPNQSERDLRQFTQWEMTIHVQNIIREWIFANLKRANTFRNIANNQVRHNKINLAIYDYIDQNVLPRIEFQNIELFIKYYSLGTTNENGDLNLQHQTYFRRDILFPSQISAETTEQYLARTIQHQKSIQATNFSQQLDPFHEKVTIVYKQTKPSVSDKWDYYFNVVYRKA